MGESFKDLVVWQRAIELTVAAYRFTGSLPASERFGLTNQLRRASVSIASNIAEGYGRSSKVSIFNFSAMQEDRTVNYKHSLSFQRLLASAQMNRESGQRNCLSK